MHGQTLECFFVKCLANLLANVSLAFCLTVFVRQMFAQCLLIWLTFVSPKSSEHFLSVFCIFLPWRSTVTIVLGSPQSLPIEKVQKSWPSPRDLHNFTRRDPHQFLAQAAGLGAGFLGACGLCPDLWRHGIGQIRTQPESQSPPDGSKQLGTDFRNG